MRLLRNLALGLASFLASLAIGLGIGEAIVSTAHAGDITYPGLNTATTVQDTDLIATWRASGPLTKVQASVLEAYVQGKLSPLFLTPANNLSDLANLTTARTNLGLGSAALATIGTSGTAVCQLNANCTKSGTETFQAKVTTGVPVVGGAMFNLPPGVAPTSPVNGDLWGTSSGVFARVAGATKQFAFLDSSITGNAATATTLATPRTIGTSGDIVCTATAFDGSANITLPGCNLPASGVGAGAYGDASHVAQVTFDAKGRATGAASVPISYPAQLPSQSGNGGADLSTNGSSAAWSMRARAYFNGVLGGLTLWGSTNATVARISAGCYTMTFANPMPSNNFTFIGTAGTPGGSGLGAHPQIIVVEDQTDSPRTNSSVGFCTLNGGSLVENNTVVNVLVEAN